MEQVFTRWPSRTQEVPASQASTGELPAWMTAPPTSPWPGRLKAILQALGVVALPCAIMLAAGLRMGAERPSAGLMAMLAAIIVAAAAVQVLRLVRTAAACGARHEAIFQRAGIAMWLEDWSAAADAVANLRREGVSDMEAHFATRPAELRALCSKVMIKDVSAFALEEAGVTDKAAVVGSLDRLLPPTDQTFVQWLVAFSRGDRFFRSEATSQDPTAR